MFTPVPECGCPVPGARDSRADCAVQHADASDARIIARATPTCWNAACTITFARPRRERPRQRLGGSIEPFAIKPHIAPPAQPHLKKPRARGSVDVRDDDGRFYRAAETHLVSVGLSIKDRPRKGCRHPERELAVILEYVEKGRRADAQKTRRRDDVDTGLVTRASERLEKSDHRAWS
jgi:hypothetical protein